MFAYKGGMDMLIKCPECGKEISDKSKMCIGCGFPIEEFGKEMLKKEEVEKEPYTICPACGKTNEMGIFKCLHCNYQYKYKDYKVIFPEDDNDIEFEGVYRYNIFGEKKEVYCPRCGGSNCSHYKERDFVAGKKKERYNINLNPLHPFTIFNKKEKVVTKDKYITKDKFICNICGKIFE